MELKKSYFSPLFFLREKSGVFLFHRKHKKLMFVFLAVTIITIHAVDVWFARQNKKRS